MRLLFGRGIEVLLYSLLKNERCMIHYFTWELLNGGMEALKVDVIAGVLFFLSRSFSFSLLFLCLWRARLWLSLVA